MGIGVVSVVKDVEHKTICVSAGLGTNNIAEWLGGIYALTLAREYYETYYDVEVSLYTDSAVIANQFNGSYKVKQKEFKVLYEEAKAIVRDCPDLKNIKFIWIPREQNILADKASKKANPYYKLKKKIKA